MIYSSNNNKTEELNYEYNDYIMSFMQTYFFLIKAFTINTVCSVKQLFPFHCSSSILSIMYSISYSPL